MVDGMVARGAAAGSGARGEGRSPASLPGPGPPGSVVSGEPLPGGSRRPDVLRAIRICDLLRGDTGLRGVTGSATPLPAPPVPTINMGTRRHATCDASRRVKAKANKATHRQGWPRPRTSAARRSLGWSPGPSQSRRGRRRRCAPAAPPCSGLSTGKTRAVREVRSELEDADWSGKGSLVRACRMCRCARLHECIIQRSEYGGGLGLERWRVRVRVRYTAQ